jgi:hypothetical protein
VPFTIVGITPPEFFGFQPGENPDLWWPLQMAPQIDRDPAARRLQAGTSWLRVVGRLSNGVERRQAEAELRVIYQRCRDEFAASRAAKWSAELRKSYSEQRLELWSAHAGWTSVRDQFRQPLLILMAVVAAVLLIACANVASLLLARSAARQREFSIRNALGAGRLRLMRQLFTESLLLAALGGVLGLLLAQSGTRLIQNRHAASERSDFLSLAPDLRVLLFTSAIALLTGLLFGLAPAFRSSRLDLAAALKQPRERGRERRTATLSPGPGHRASGTFADIARGRWTVLFGRYATSKDWMPGSIVRTSFCSTSILPSAPTLRACEHFKRNCSLDWRCCLASEQRACSISVF